MWTNVTDRLPEPDDYVLIRYIDEGNDRFCCGYYHQIPNTDEYGWTGCDCEDWRYCWCKFIVMHWMPYPDFEGE